MPAFLRAGEKHLEALARGAEVVRLAPGKTITSPDGHGAFYIVSEGYLRVFDPGDPNQRSIEQLHQGAVFNDGPIHGDVRSRLAIQAETPSVLLGCSFRHVNRLRQDDSAFASLLDAGTTERDARKFIETSTVLSVLPPEAFQQLIGSLSRRTLASGEMLMREGERADAVYLVAQGWLRVFHQETPEETVARLGAGSLVGEMGVLNQSVRTADVAADTACTVLAAPAPVFLELMSQQQSLADRLAALVKERSGSSAPAAAETMPVIDKTTATEETATGPEQQPDVMAWSNAVTNAPGRGFARFFGPRITLQQSEMDCGAACVGTVCRFYGRVLGLNRLRKLINVGLSGSSMYDLKMAAETLGFETFAYRQRMIDLKANHVPAIVNWRGYHWVVVQRIRNGRVRIADPGTGFVDMPETEFNEGWTGYVLYMRPTAAFTAVADEPISFAPLVPFLRGHRASLLSILVAALCFELLQLLIPLLSKFIIDNVVMSKQGRWLLPAVAGVAAGSLASTFIVLLRQRLLMYVSADVSLRLAQNFWTRLLQAPLSFFESRRTGDITSRLGETENIGHFLAGRAIGVLVDAFGAVVYLGLMWYMSWKLTLVAVCASALDWLNLWLVSPRLREGFRAQSQRAADASNHLVESLGGLRTIKILGIERHIRWTYDHLLTRQINASFATLRYTVIADLARTAIGRVGGLLVLFLGASMVLGGEFSIGTLVAFTVLMGGLFGPIAALTGFWDEVQHLLTSFERLGDVFEANIEPGSTQSEELVEMAALQGQIRFSGVSFRYSPESREVLHNVQLEIAPGSTVAFVGRSGSGKSTLIKLLLGFSRPTGGSIIVDGVDLAKIWLPSLRRQVGLVPQDAHLFRDTVRANIRYGNPDASDAEVEEAARQGDAHSFISALPQAYETVLEERGANLSGGQRQRIALARALLQNPRLLILDEASSALDTESERFVFQNLRNHFKDRTILMVAHRLSTVRHADEIVVLDRGLIVEQGSHEDLMARRRLYYTLNTQRFQV